MSTLSRRTTVLVRAATITLACGVFALPAGVAATTAYASAHGSSAGQPATADAMRSQAKDNGNGPAQSNGQGNGKGNGPAKDSGQAQSSNGNDQSKGNGHGNGKGADHGSAPAVAAGSTTAPQPPSHADFTGNGANTHGPYDSTRNGAPSGNGNGNGKAVGKPCAGCVGKADNKNPKGQLPGGSDHNNGYECDGNHGIGRTNPAHTGCTATPTPTPPPTSPPACTSDCTSPPPTCSSDCHTGTPTPTPTHTPGGTPSPTPSTTGTPSPSTSPSTSTQCPDGSQPTAEGCVQVLGEKHTRSPSPSTQVLATKVVRGGSLPFTGTDVLTALIVALAALGGGVALLVAGRRRGSAG